MNNRLAFLPFIIGFRANPNMFYRHFSSTTRNSKKFWSATNAPFVHVLSPDSSSQTTFENLPPFLVPCVISGLYTPSRSQLPNTELVELHNISDALDRPSMSMISTLRRRLFKFKRKKKKLRVREEMRRKKYTYKIVHEGSTRKARRTPREIYKYKARRGKLYPGQSRYVFFGKPQRWRCWWWLVICKRNETHET